MTRREFGREMAVAQTFERQENQEWKLHLHSNRATWQRDTVISP